MIDVQQIRRVHIDARKDLMKNQNTKSQITSLLLSTFISDIEKIEKTYKKTITEQEIISLIKQYLKGINDTEKVAGITEKTSVEREVLTSFLPPQKSEVELTALIDAAIQTVSATSIKEFGKVMAIIKKDHEGTYDNESAARIIKAKLEKGA